ncbi:MAG: pyridoxamine kinase, partial [Oscillospiraceae bacterium]
MEALKRIAAVNDISGVGKCSITVALPVISASGVECALLPTALLSTHTGGFEGYTFKDLTDEMLPIAQHWKNEKIPFDGVYSGYLATAEQAKTLEAVIELLATPATKIIVDPVMADNGEYYCNHGDEMCAGFKRLCARADIITPNITEAALLTGLPYKNAPHNAEYIDALLGGLGALCHGIIAITGVSFDNKSLGVVALDSKTGERCFFSRPTAPGVFCGTGDIFASAFSALMLRGAGLSAATETAVSLVGDSIERTVLRNDPRRMGVDFEGALAAYVSKVAAMFA